MLIQLQTVVMHLIVETLRANNYFSHISVHLLKDWICVNCKICFVWLFDIIDKQYMANFTVKWIRLVSRVLLYSFVWVYYQLMSDSKSYVRLILLQYVSVLQYLYWCLIAIYLYDFYFAYLRTIYVTIHKTITIIK